MKIEQAETCPTCGKAWEAEMQETSLTERIAMGSGHGTVTIPATTKHEVRCAEGHVFAVRASMNMGVIRTFSIAIPEPPLRSVPFPEADPSGPCSVCRKPIQGGQAFLADGPYHVGCSPQ